jgi:hypothetical protein
MARSATARAQAGHQKLEQLVQSLKRTERAVKESIRLARQAQCELLGIEVTTTHPGGTVDNEDRSQDRDAGAALT